MRENVRSASRGRAGRERWEFALDNRQIAAVAVGAMVIVGSSFVLGMNAGKGMARQSAKPAAANSLEAFDAAHENLPTLPEPKSWEYEKLGGAHASEAAPTGASAGTAQARVPPPARPLTPRGAPEPAATTAATTTTASAAPAPAAAPDATAPGAAHTTSTVAVATADAQAKGVSPDAPKPATGPSPRVTAPAAAAPAVRPAATPSAMDKALAAVSGTAPRTAPPAVATPVASPKPGAAGNGSAYVIQVGASPNRTEADRIAKRFASRGARVVTADVDGKRWYRVRLASITYDDRSEAERALSRLSRETGVRGFVTAAR